jgi:hypothetical protein
MTDGPIEEPLIRSQQRSDGDRTNVLVFTLVCVLCGISSGGLILGVGPFLAKMVDANYFVDRCDDGETGCAAQYAAIGPIFNGGFQIMTWFSCIAGVMCDRYGARYTAMLGMLMAAAGHLLLFYGFGSADTSVIVFTIGYGLIGGGGNMMYIPAFQFAGLFKAQGLPCSIISGLFNLSGMVFLLLNSSAISLQGLFLTYVYLSIAIFFFVAVFFPDVPYASLTEPDDEDTCEEGGRNCASSIQATRARCYRIQPMACFKAGGSSGQGRAGTGGGGQEQVGSNSNSNSSSSSSSSGGGGGGGGGGSSALWQEIKQPRFISFVILFSWAGEGYK